MAAEKRDSSQPLPSGADLFIPWHLRLPGALERDFIHYLLQFSRRTMVGAVVIILAVYICAFVVEMLINMTLIEQTWRLRLFSLIPIGAIWWQVRTNDNPKFLQPVIAIATLILAGTHDYAAITTSHELAYSYYLVSIFAILLMGTLLRISLYWSLAVSILILIQLAITLNLDLGISQGLAIVLFFFVFGSAILSLFGQYFFERLQRQHFLVERVLATHRNELHSANQILESQVNEDALTGTVNRRGMSIRLGSLIHHARQNQQLDRLYVLILDIDFFKQFNDTYGHLAGDECLKKIVDVPQSMLQNDVDFVARYGGEEFVLVLSGIQLNDALVFAERMRSRIERLGIEHTGSRISNVVTISIGIAGLIPGVTRAEEFIKRADEALYEAKGGGRNKVVYITEQDKLEAM